MSTIINKVENSGLVTLDLEDFYPNNLRLVFDIKDYLYQELILKEKDFREALTRNDWSIYQDAFVTITNSSEAIMPSWAKLLIASHLTPIAKLVSFGSLEDLEKRIFFEIVSSIDIKEYQEKKVIIKGCSKKDIPESAYVLLVQKLKPIVNSLMFGEACSTVPIYKKG